MKVEAIVVTNKREQKTETIENTRLVIIRDDQGTPITILTQYKPIGSMTQFQCLTPQHGEEFQQAVRQLGLTPVQVAKTDIAG
jgi:hypothetical protein